MKKVTFKEKLQYRLDNLMLGGTKSMVALLLISTIIVIVACGVALALAMDTSVGYGVWKSLMHAFDGGTMGGDDEPLGYMVPMFVVTVFGIVVFSTLVGVINNALENKLASLDAGNFKIIENNHILILGFDSEIYSILNELILANEENIDSSNNGGTVVILDSYLTPQEMREQVDSQIHDKKNTKIIYRKGTIYNTDAIEKCSADTAKNIVVNVDNDAVALKCILASNLILEKYNNKTTKIIAVMKENDNKIAAVHAVGDRLLALDFDSILAKMIAQSSRYQGISGVFEELFSFDGSEFYIEPISKGLVGKRLIDASAYYNEATVIGKLTKQGETKLIPVSSKDEFINEGDRLIFLAEDDSLIRANDEACEYNEIKNEFVLTDSLSAPKTVLIMRYSPKLDAILEEGYLISKLSNVVVAVEKSTYADEQTKRNIERIKKRYAEYKLEFRIVDAFGRNEINDLVNDIGPDSIIVLSRKEGTIETLEDELAMHVQCEREDAKIMFILLLLRSIAEDNGYDFTITSELQYCENQKLARDTGVNDFIVGSSITNMIRAQIADDTNRYDLFLDLITSEGTELSFRYADEMFELNVPLTCLDIKMFFAEQNMVFLGYRKLNSKEGMKETYINPSSNETITFEEGDIVIVLTAG